MNEREATNKNPLLIPNARFSLDLSWNEQQPRSSASIRLESRQPVLHSLAAVILGRGGLDN